MSKIEWCDHSVNVVDGCSPASPGCDHCYAARMRGTRHAHLPCTLPSGTGTNADLVTIGKTRDGKRRYVYNGAVALDTGKLAKALRMPRSGGMRYPVNPETSKADKSKPKEPAGNRVFWNFQSDTFHERLSFTEIAAQFAVMASRPDLRFLVLTKRPQRAAAFFAWCIERPDSNGDPVSWLPWGTAIKTVWPGAPIGETLRSAIASHPRHIGPSNGNEWPLLNVAVGVSAEDQKRWDERVPVLLDMKERGNIARAFVSAEPMIGPIDPVLRMVDVDGGESWIDQVIIGAESGPGARPCKLEWIQGLAAAVVGAQEPCSRCDAKGGWGRITKWSPNIVWQECPRCLGEGSTGPRLFVKQADVCGACAGERIQWSPDRRNRSPCSECGGAGHAGKVRKGCPELHIPGRGAGTRSWAQRMEGF